MTPERTEDVLILSSWPFLRLSEFSVTESLHWEVSGFLLVSTLASLSIFERRRSLGPFYMSGISTLLPFWTKAFHKPIPGPEIPMCYLGLTSSMIHSGTQSHLALSPEQRPQTLGSMTFKEDPSSLEVSISDTWTQRNPPLDMRSGFESYYWHDGPPSTLRRIRSKAKSNLTEFWFLRFSSV